MKKFLPYLVCIASGTALGFVLDGELEGNSAWFALVPLMLFSRFNRPGIAARHGFAFAFPMWIVSLRWLLELRHNGGPLFLVLPALLALSAYCAAYTALFAAFVSKTHSVFTSRFGAVGAACLHASGWCGGEYIRFNLLSGFAWNALGVAQIANLPIIQVAALGGVYAVSFIVVLFNAAIAGVAVRMWRNIRKPGSESRRHFDLMTALAVVLVASVWGSKRANKMNAAEAAAPTVSIAAMNPNVPCIFDRDRENYEIAWENLIDNTERIVADFAPDLIVWPETILPLAIPTPQMMFEQIMADFASDFGAPILAGGMEYDDVAEYENVARGAKPLCYNSSFLFTPDGIGAFYRKQHLVPFGEYIPLDKTLVWLQNFAMTGVTCTPGAESVLIPVVAKSAPSPHPVAFISPLICFEDTVASLSRAAARKGADIIVVQSNDAWFAGSNEARQHNNQAVFRAVETARPVVRSSNSGMMSVISSYGRSSGEEYDTLFCQPVPILRDFSPTLYTRCGDWIFGIPCAILFCVSLFMKMRSRGGNLPPELPNF